MLFCFVLLVTVRSLGLCVPYSHSWYRREALYKEGCTNFVSWRSDSQQKRDGILKLLWIKHWENYLYFYLYYNMKIYCIAAIARGTLVLYLRLFVLFVTVRSLKLWVPRLCSLYRRKALNEQGCTGFVLWHLKFIKFRRFCESKKIVFTFILLSYSNGTRHTTTVNVEI